MKGDIGAQREPKQDKQKAGEGAGAAVQLRACLVTSSQGAWDFSPGPQHACSPIVPVLER